MRHCFLILLLAFTSEVLGQTSVFKEMVKQMDLTSDTSYAIEPAYAAAEDFDFTVRSESDLEAIFLAELSGESKKGALQRNESLSRLAQAATQAWYGSQYTDKDRWKRLEKYFNRANHQIVSAFNLMDVVSFRVPLMHKPRKGFYYDRKGPEGALNLYEGDRPVTEEEKEAEPIPLRFLTEEEILEHLIKQMKRLRKFRFIKKGTFDYIGVSIVVDQKSLYKTRIPTARVVVVLGAKRLKYIKV